MDGMLSEIRNKSPNKNVIISSANQWLSYIIFCFFEVILWSSEIARECNRDLIAVTYDLAIAKIALQIQNEEKTAFDHLFVNLDAFHIDMTLLELLERL